MWGHVVLSQQSTLRLDVAEVTSPLAEYTGTAVMVDPQLRVSAAPIILTYRDVSGISG
jgi:hypothetical protein